MIEVIINWSLKHRFLVIAVWLLLAGIGVWSLMRLPLDAFPDTMPVQVVVNTTAPALAPSEIEPQITAPIEQALSGLPGLEEVRSISDFGLSQVTLIFNDRTNLYLARQMTAERLTTAPLPDSVGKPELGPIATGLGEIFHYLVTGTGYSLTELRTVQDWIIKPQLRAVPGVAEVNTWGGAEKEYQVTILPDHLLKFGLTMDQVSEALRVNNQNVGGGVITRGGQASLVQGVGIVTSTPEIAGIVVAARDGVPVTVGDVARVELGHGIRHGAVTVEGQGEGVLGLGFLLSGQNSREVTMALSQRARELAPSLPPGMEIKPVYLRTQLVEWVIDTVKRNLLEGALLVIALLFLFLGHLRAGLLVAAAIPLSLLFAFGNMVYFGIAGSLMSLGAIDFGLIVDSSVIQVENAMRHLAGNNSTRSKLEVVRKAVMEVRQPTMFGELIIMVVYLPILTLQGIEGKLFRPMALTVIFALMGSMLLSFTLTPVLASLALPRSPRHGDGWLMRLLKAGYRPVVQGVLRAGGLVLIGAVLAVIGAAGLATRLGTEFVPRLNEMSIVFNIVRLTGVSLEESVRQTTQMERILRQAFPDEIQHIWSRTGTAEVATDPMGVQLSDVFMTLHPVRQWRKAKTQSELVERMRAELADFPGVRVVFTQPIEMRINEMLAGIRSDVGVKIFGDDFEVLEAKAQEVAEIIRNTPGATDVGLEQLTGTPMVSITVNQAAIARFGISARQVLEVVEALGGIQVDEVREGQRRFPLVVRLDEPYRHDPALVGQVLVSAPDGQRIPLARLATIAETSGPSRINREWGRRRIVVDGNITGRDVGSFMHDLQDRIAKQVSLPAGYYIRYGGQFEHLVAGMHRLAVVVPLSLLIIFLLLFTTYNRWLDALRVFSGIPLAAVGGIIALWLRSLPFSISAGIGFVVLCGCAVLGDMVLVSTIRRLLGIGRPLHEAVLEAAETRLRPVLMTGLVAALGFVPMAFNTGVGAEVQRPLATVVLGGVVSSTCLTLVVLPALFYAVERRWGKPPA